MSHQSTNPARNADSPKVYVGAYLPFWLYHLLVEEAEQMAVSRSEVIRRALIGRYGEQPSDAGSAVRSKEYDGT
jgi:hypothetical protein